MSDKKQMILPPSSTRLPALRASTPSLPALNPGNSAWLFELGRLQRNTAIVSADADYLRARTDQAGACLLLIKKREELLLAIASLHDLPEKVAHQRELGRLDRLNELHLRHLQHELFETNARIEVAAANMRLAATLPIPEVPQPAPAPPPAAPAGFSVDDVVTAVDELTDHMEEIPPEARKHLSILLSSYLKDKRK
jgi:hypothetical protein